MKKSLFCALLILMAGVAVASPVSPKRAATVAQNFWQSLYSSPKLGEVPEGRRSVSLTQIPWQYDGIYLFTSEAGGYVLVAADDAVRPILGYSTTGTLDPDDMPPALQQWLQGYGQQISLQREAKRPYPNGKAEWIALESGQPLLSTKEGVAPLIATRWDQDYPYNGYCPGSTVTGCAATAQAQVMNFWQHPAFGKGSHTYTLNRYGRLEADFEHTLYDWEGMPTEATMSSSDREKEAVATLMYHCGVSLEMRYATAAEGGSGATGLTDEVETPCINQSLRDYFYYSPSMRVINKYYGFSNDQWRDSLMAELDQGRPIVYTGQGPAGGHGFICDGYDGRGYMHFNFGWSGRGDGYFPVDSICPGTGGVGGGSYQFNDYNSALLCLFPLYDLRLSDTLMNLVRVGGTDSVLFCIDPTDEALPSVTSNAGWLTASLDEGATSGWLRYVATANNSGNERTGLITLSQGDRLCTLRVVQSGWDEEELCPVTVVMESTRGEGWQGNARLTLESDSGYLFGTATLTDKEKDSVVILVAPHHLNSIWHSGGGTDRYINYFVKNQHGETLISAVYAYRTGGTHHIEWPCAHLGIPEFSIFNSQLSIYPNPTEGMLTVKADGLQRMEVMDMSGRRVAITTDAYIDMSHLPAGAYFVRILTNATSSVQRIVKK